jgi:hypothetical protein
MLQQLTLHSQQIIKTTSTQDLDPRSLANNDHPSILPFEMYDIEPGFLPLREGKKNRPKIFKTNPVYGRSVNFFVLVCSLSSHRHSYIPLIFGSRFIDS